MEKQLSVIVPVYNGEKYIKTCIESLQAQTYDDIEIIMIDDGSSDDTPQLLDEYAGRDDRIVVIHQENKGLSGARNAGIMRATGKYVWFFDVDDEVKENIIEDNLSLAMENDADLVMFSFWYYNVDTKEKIENQMHNGFVGSREQFFDNKLIDTINHEIFNAPWNKIIKRSVLIENNIFFDSKFPIYEDITFAPCLLMAAQTVVVNPKMYYIYYVRSSGSLITKFYENFFESVSQFHINANAYCDEFDNNLLQKKSMDELYTRLVIMHMKQISCNKNLDKTKKLELLQKICTDKRFIGSVKNTDFKGKRKYIKKLILNRNYTAIINLYRIVNKIQGEKM